MSAVQFIPKITHSKNRKDGQNGHYASMSVGPFTNKEAAKYYLNNTIKKRLN